MLNRVRIKGLPLQQIGEYADEKEDGAEKSLKGVGHNQRYDQQAYLHGFTGLHSHLIYVGCCQHLVVIGGAGLQGNQSVARRGGGEQSAR